MRGRYMMILKLLSYVIIVSGAEETIGPKIILHPRNTIVNKDASTDSVRFSCTANGNPLPTISWTKNGKPIIQSDYHNIDNSQGILEIMKPNQDSDNGIYQCIATNNIGAVFSNVAELTFAYVDDFDGDAPEPVVINANLGVCLTCNPPSGFPGIKSEWKKDTGENTIPVVLNNRVAVMMDTRLCFAYTNVSDTGSYRCYVSNIYDNLGATQIRRSGPVELEVNKAGPNQNLIEVPNQISNITAQMGDDVVIECVFLGRPAPTLTWTKDGSQSLAYMQDLDNQHRLTIRNAQPSDSGVYQCTDENNELTVSRTLTVFAPPALTRNIRDQKVLEHSSVTFTCDVEAESEELEYSWYHNTDEIHTDTADRQYALPKQNILYIRNSSIKHSGMYQCFVHNRHGMTSTTSYLLVETTLSYILPAFTRAFTPHSELANSRNNSPSINISWQMVSFVCMLLVYFKLFQET